MVDIVEEDLLDVEPPRYKRIVKNGVVVHIKVRQKLINNFLEEAKSS